MNYMEEVMAPAEARYKAAVMYETWGHLEPKPGRYPGWIIFANTCGGLATEIDYAFEGVNACPGVYDDLQQWIGDKCHGKTQGPGFPSDRAHKLCKEVGVYRLDGHYTRYRNGKGRFSGKIRRLVTMPKE